MDNRIMAEYSQEPTEEYMAHLKHREGTLNVIYKDSLGKPTGGTGHLMTDADKKNYGIDGDTKYVDHKIEGITYKVATDKEGNIITLDKDDMSDWLTKDSKKAYSSAISQAKGFGISDQKMINALGAVNFQLGSNWKDKGFTNTWAALKSGNFDLAASEATFQNTGATGNVFSLDRTKQVGTSDWAYQTPDRVQDFTTALRDYGVRRDIDLLDHDKVTMSTVEPPP